MNKEDLIKRFNMSKHPEGGAFVETYRSSFEVESPEFDGLRNASTGICFLLGEDEFSAFHRIKSDEMWHFYLGGPLKIIEISPDGTCIETILGNDLSKGHHLQYVVKAGHWFASQPLPESDYSLVGCTVAPGFEFSDFELATKSQLSSQFPLHEELIEKLTRN